MRLCPKIGSWGPQPLASSQMSAAAITDVQVKKGLRRYIFPRNPMYIFLVITGRKLLGRYILGEFVKFYLAVRSGCPPPETRWGKSEEWGKAEKTIFKYFALFPHFPLHAVDSFLIRNISFDTEFWKMKVLLQILHKPFQRWGSEWGSWNQGHLARWASNHYN